MLHILVSLLKLNKQETHFIWLFVIIFTQLGFASLVYLEPGNEYISSCVIAWAVFGAVTSPFFYNEHTVDWQRYYDMTIYGMVIVLTSMVFIFVPQSAEARVIGKVTGGLMLYDAIFQIALLFLHRYVYGNDKVQNITSGQAEYDSFFQKIMPVTAIDRAFLFVTICLVIRLTIGALTYKFAKYSEWGYVYATLASLSLLFSVFYLHNRVQQPWWYSGAGEVYRLTLVMFILIVSVMSLLYDQYYNVEKMNVVIAIAIIIDASRGATHFAANWYKLVTPVREWILYSLAIILMISFAISVNLKVDTFVTTTNFPTTSPTQSPTPPTAQPTLSPTQSPVVPCNVYNTPYTPYTPDTDSYSYVTLTNLHVQCPDGQLFRQLQLGYTGGSGLRYTYTCCNMGLPYTMTFPAFNKSNSPTEKGLDYAYLDRQKVTCGNIGSTAPGGKQYNLLKGFQLKLPTSNTIRYDMNCLDTMGGSDLVITECRHVQNAFTDGSSAQNPHFLDRQLLACADGEFIQSFQLVKSWTDPTNGWNSYSYDCCSVVPL